MGATRSGGGRGGQQPVQPETTRGPQLPASDTPRNYSGRGPRALGVRAPPPGAEGWELPQQ